MTDQETKERVIIRPGEPRVGEVKAGERVIGVHMQGIRFHADVDGSELHAPSFEEIEKKIRAEVSRTRVQLSIPVILRADRHMGRNFPGHHYYVRATLRGKNARTSQYLFTIEKTGEKVSMEHPTIVALGGQLTDEQLLGLNKLEIASQIARQAVSDFLFDRVKENAGFSAWKLIEAEEKKVLEKVS